MTNPCLIGVIRVQKLYIIKLYFDGYVADTDLQPII
jgi:hypothetical protein